MSLMLYNPTSTINFYVIITKIMHFLRRMPVILFLQQLPDSSFNNASILGYAHCCCKAKLAFRDQLCCTVYMCSTNKTISISKPKNLRYTVPLCGLHYYLISYSTV